MVVGGGDSGSCSCGGADGWFYFFIFVFDGGGRQWLVVGMGLQRKWWVFRERERQRERKREYKKQYLNEMVKKIESLMYYKVRC